MSVSKSEMGKTIVIANQKGGVGKTTTAINLAASLAMADVNILVIDTDPQGNLTSGLGISRKEIRYSLYDIYNSNLPAQQAIIKTTIPHLHLIPSTIDLLGIEIEIVNRERREGLLREAILPIKDRYRYIFIDCPPSLGLLTLNAMVAADSLLIPVQCEYYSLEGLSLIYDTMSRVQRAFNPNLKIEGILMTMFDSRNTLSHSVYEEIKKNFPEEVYDTVINRNITLAEAPSFGKPAVIYDPRSKGAQNYQSLCKEILNEDSPR